MLSRFSSLQHIRIPSFTIRVHRHYPNSAELCPIHYSGQRTSCRQLVCCFVGVKVVWRITPIVFIPIMYFSGWVTNTPSAPVTSTVLANSTLVPMFTCTSTGFLLVLPQVLLLEPYATGNVFMNTWYELTFCMLLSILHKDGCGPLFLINLYTSLLNLATSCCFWQLYNVTPDIASLDSGLPSPFFTRNCLQIPCSFIYAFFLPHVIDPSGSSLESHHLNGISSVAIDAAWSASLISRSTRRWTETPSRTDEKFSLDSNARRGNSLSFMILFQIWPGISTISYCISLKCFPPGRYSVYFSILPQSTPSWACIFFALWVVCERQDHIFTRMIHRKCQY